MILVMGLTVSACNTVRGMGTDIKKAGQKVEQAF